MRDLTESVVPMARLLHNLGYVPYRLARLVAREGTFINAMGAVEFFRMRDVLRCNMVIARRRRAKA
ncbi:hypothetical protein [Nonomuraea lactucae]|uniref:hypothetical protein n=1 Tax=Nonomuraea lactucae TaxID=2249762 RepID=UPI001F068065|nr:hypothetical protein [Nonomuraea lactucae]